MAFNSWGSSRFPLAAAGAIDTASARDIGLQAVAGLVTAAINADCGAEWRRLVAFGNDRHCLRGSVNPVQYTLAGVRPSAQTLTQIKVDWPLLTVYREGSELQWLASGVPAWKQRWGIDWIVGALDPASIQRYGSFWLQVLHAISAAIVDGHHPSYLNDAECFSGSFVEINPTSETGAGLSDELTNDKGAGYFGGSVALESLERYVPQSGALLDELNAAGTAYAPVDAGYGDTVTETLVSLPMNFGTPEPVGD